MVMDDDHESAEHSLPHSEALVGQVYLLTPAEEPGSSSSLSPSSTCSSLSASFFQEDESKFYVDDKIIASLSISGELPSKKRTDEAFPTSESLPSLSGWEHNNTATREQSEHDPNESQPNSAKFCQESTGSPQSPNEVDSDDETNLGSPGTPTSMQNESVLQSPPVQVMERPDISSSYRIPSHVFERSKSVNPAEWSVASNESLFSIQVGNASFSRDAGFQVAKSGELFSLKDRVYSKSPLATIPAVDAENRGSGFEEDSGLLYAAAVETTKDVNEDRNKAWGQSEEGNFKSSNDNSIGSGAGAFSSAFPIKKRKKRKKGCEWLCCCFKCCRPCCDCAWPSCSCPKGCCDFKCPKCSPSCCNFTRPSCFTPKLGSTCCSGSKSTSTCFNCGWPACSCSKCSPGGSHCSCSSCCEPCSCAWPSCSSCSNCCAWPSCSSCCAWPSCSSCCAWPSCSSRCAWPSCSSCSSCCAWPSCSSCFSCCRTCGHCKWPSCSCCCPCSSCKWSMCPCSSCSLMCCKWPWTACCRSNRCRSCQFKSPPCCLPNCGGCCCHSTGVSRRNRSKVTWFGEVSL